MISHGRRWVWGIVVFCGCYFGVGVGLLAIGDFSYGAWIGVVGVGIAVFGSLFAFWQQRTVYRTLKTLSQSLEPWIDTRVNAPQGHSIAQWCHHTQHGIDVLLQHVTVMAENEQRMKQVLHHLLGGGLMIDAHGHVVWQNARASQFLGYSVEELYKQPYTKIKTAFRLAQKIDLCMQTGEYAREEVETFYPEKRNLDVQLFPMPTQAQGRGVLVLMQDLSEIRRLERIRNEFVSNVTHELKTPITAIRGFTETLLKGALQDENTATSFLQIIAEESERLHRLIGDVLYLSKVESKQIELHYSPLELHAFFERIFLIMKNQAHSKKIQLEMKIPLETYVEADEDRLRQIVLNLLSNAIAYSNEGGWVSVTVESGETDDPQQEGLVTRLIVEDGGMGIPKHDLPRIFERFYRVDKARTRQSGGTGLGLSIAKHLVELHRGTIAVESTVGVGTRFTIEIPTVQW